MDNSSVSKKRLILLVLRAQSGDREAMDRLLQTHQSDLFGYLTKMLGNYADAEDALQSTMLQAAKKLRWLRKPEYFRSWIYRIASRFAYGTIKRRRQKIEMTNMHFIDETVEIDLADTQVEDLIGQIPEWLERLTPKGREAVMLHYLEGFTTEDVAEILGVPLGTAKSRISYALACIRKQLISNERTNS